MDKQLLREAAERRVNIMWTKMRQREKDWQRYREAFSPARGRFSTGPQPDEGKQKDDRRKHSAPYKIAEEFAAGMQAGLASPSRDWLNLTLFDTRLATIERSKAWLGGLSEIVSARLLQSNFYDQFTDFQKEQGVFGTAAMFIEEDDEEIFFCKVLTAGQYAIDTNHKGRVNRFCRRLVYTLSQLVEDFGYDALPPQIKMMLSDKTRRDSAGYYEVAHLIQPNAEYQTAEMGPKGMAFQSLWWIPGSSEPEFLRISGYNEFPVIVGRWRTVGEDVYGREHPGEMALDDANTLQGIETDGRGALQRMVTPPMLGPADLKGKLDNRPNRITFYHPAGNPGGPPVVQPLFNVNFDFRSAWEKNSLLIQDIERAFYVDLFRMWASDMRLGRTATEVEAREQEKMYILAPITMRQISEVMNRIVIRVYSIMSRAGLFPEPPPDLAGQQIRIEYLSEFSLLQKRTAEGGMNALLAFTERLCQLQIGAGQPPEALDRIDADQIIEDVSSMYGLDAGIVLGDDVVAQIREDRAMAMQQQQEVQMMAQAAQLAPDVASAAKDVSEMGGMAM